jgi:hypothetical protein
MGNSNSTNDQRGGSINGSMNDNDIRSIIENIVRNTKTNSLNMNSDLETINLSDVESSISMSSINMSSSMRNNKRLRGAGHENLFMSVPNDAGCGCSGENQSKDSDLSATSSFMVSANKPLSATSLSATSPFMDGGNKLFNFLISNIICYCQ